VQGERGSGRAGFRKSGVQGERGAGRAGCRESGVQGERGAGRAGIRESGVQGERGAGRGGFYDCSGAQVEFLGDFGLRRQVEDFRERGSCNCF
jgi:hypothetical protein